MPFPIYRDNYNMKSPIPKSIYKRFETYIDIARALKDKKQTGKSFHITVVTHKKKILSIGINNYDRVVTNTRYGKYKVFGEDSYKPCLHSEISALLKLGREDCSDLEFFNIRIDNNNNIGASKPCDNCLNMLKIVGYKRIYYFTSETIIEYIK